MPVLAGRALSVVRVLRGQAAFMQKNLPAYAPAAITTLEVPTQDGKRVVRYPVCDDRETLLWFANQRGRVPPDTVPRACVRRSHTSGPRP